LGIPETKLSFFNIDLGVDTGDLLLQVPITIAPDDTAIDLFSKINRAAYEGTKTLCGRFLEEPTYSGLVQDHNLANYWRKRTPHDVTLDFRMSASFIQRTVRSFAAPYPCANLIFEDSVIKITNAAVSTKNENLTEQELQRMEPGKILAVNGDTLVIKADDAIMDLTFAGDIPERLKRAKYIHPPTKYLAERPDLLDAR
jgi:methionyl-tRNA formyltransferase